VGEEGERAGILTQPLLSSLRIGFQQTDTKPPSIIIGDFYMISSFQLLNPSA